MHHIVGPMVEDDRKFSFMNTNEPSKHPKMLVPMFRQIYSIIRETILKEKCSFFNIVQKAFDPPTPPFVWTSCGEFFKKRFWALKMVVIMKKQKKVEKNIFWGLNCRGRAQGTGRVYVFLNDAPPYTMARMSSPHLKCCINVGFREAPCKKSFGILASYWTPPKIK